MARLLTLKGATRSTPAPGGRPAPPRAGDAAWEETLARLNS
jgi:hypothetical protein